MEKLQEMKTENHGSIRSYTIGFILSIVLTFAAYIAVMIHENSYHKVLSHELLIPLLLIFAFAQLVVQLVFFLHILNESKPRWNLFFFVSTFSLVLLVVVMSIWIINHLNNNMTPADMTNYLMKYGEGF